MTTTKEPDAHTTTGKLSMAEILEIFTATGRQPLKFTAYDGSTAGRRRRRAGPGSSDAPWRHLPGHGSRRTRHCPRVRIG